MTRREDVQGLRALAVAIVILDHAGLTWLGHGFIGVDVFFVVSGFVITSLLVHEVTTSGRLRLLAFYAKRARRILPAATLVLVATTAWATVLTSGARAARISDDAVWSAFFGANIRFADAGTDYFAEDLEPSPLQHYWSLAVEEQFYLLWPGLVLVLAMLLRETWSRVLAWCLGLTCFASFSLFVVLFHVSPAAAYFSAPGRAWELGAGALVAVTADRWKGIGSRSRDVLAVGGLIAIFATAALPGESTSNTPWVLVAPVLGTALVLLAGCRTVPRASRVLLGARPLQWVGDVSYSLYLWHWPVLTLGASDSVGEPQFEPGILIGVTFGLAALTYYTVENPFRHSRRLWAGPTRGLSLWPLALAATFVTVSWSAHAIARVEQDRRVQSQHYYASEAPTEMTKRSVAERIAQALEYADDDAPIPEVMNLDNLRSDNWESSFSCFASYRDTTAAVCPLGESGAPRVVVAMGDSHMGMWLPALDVLGRRQHFQVVPFIKFSCAPYDVDLAIKEVGGDYTECEDFRAWSREQVRNLRPTAVLLAARGLSRGLATTSDAERGTAWQEGVVSAVNNLQRLAPSVIVLADVPQLHRDPADCLTDRHANLGDCVSSADHRVHLANQLLREAAAATGAVYADPTSLVCYQRRCPYVVDRIATYSDDDHVSVTWARAVARELGRLLE